MTESLYVPGTRVRHPEHPEWGLGLVQTAINGRVTVNFEERGKVVIDVSKVDLTVLFESDRFRN